MIIGYARGSIMTTERNPGERAPPEPTGCRTCGGERYIPSLYAPGEEEVCPDCLDESDESLNG